MVMSPVDNFAVCSINRSVLMPADAELDQILSSVVSFCTKGDVLHFRKHHETLSAIVRLLDDVDMVHVFVKIALRNELQGSDVRPKRDDAVVLESLHPESLTCRFLSTISLHSSFSDQVSVRLPVPAIRPDKEGRQGILEVCERNNRSLKSRADLHETFGVAFSQLLSSVVSSSSEYPGILKLSISFLLELLKRAGVKLEMRMRAAMKLFTLSLLVPALVQPSEFGLDENSLSEEARKLLREMANGITGYYSESLPPSFGAASAFKEALEGMQLHLSEFLDGFVNTWEGAATAPTNEEEEELFEDDVDSLVDFLKTHGGVVAASLKASGHTSSLRAFEDFVKKSLESSSSKDRKTKKKSLLQAGRVCTIPGLAKIKSKGRILGFKYREARSDEEDDDSSGSSSEMVAESTFNRRRTSAEREERRKEEEFGVGLQFESDEQGYFIVSELSSGGPAQRCGMIEVGDILVDVDGQNVYLHKSPMVLLRKLLSGKEGASVQLGLQKPGSGQTRQVMLRRSEQYDSESATERARLMNSSGQLRPRVRVRKATLSKGKSERLKLTQEGRSQLEPPSSLTSTSSVGSERLELSGVGITLQMGGEFPYVSDISEKGPAERNGCLTHGDEIVAINESSCRNRTFQECSRMLNGPMGSFVKLELRSSAAFDASEQQTQTVMLRRTWVPDLVWNEAGDEAAPALPAEPKAPVPGGNEMFGVGITFVQTGAGFFSVRRIATMGPADVAGTVRIGDVIQTVDGFSVRGKSMKKFAGMILGPLATIVQLGILRGEEEEFHLIQLERGPSAAETEEVRPFSLISLLSPSRSISLPPAGFPPAACSLLLPRAPLLSTALLFSNDYSLASPSARSARALPPPPPSSREWGRGRTGRRAASASSARGTRQGSTRSCRCRRRGPCPAARAWEQVTLSSQLTGGGCRGWRRRRCGTCCSALRAQQSTSRS
eukprot:768620-Hanusia_phi.AAC.3